MDYTHWEFHGTEPIYKQLYQRLLVGILSSQLQPGEYIPSIRVMANTLHINANTVARAYKLLCRNGLLETIGGKSRITDACFIQERRGQEAHGLCRNFLHTMTALGFTIEEAIAFVQEYTKK